MPAKPPGGADEARQVHRGLAVGVSVLMVGAGHVLLGRWRRGLVWLSGLFALLVTIPWTKGIGLLLVLSLYLLTQVDVLLVEARPRPRGRELVLLLLGLFVSISSVQFAVRSFLVESFKLPSESMMPALLPGDHVMCVKVHGDVERGDIVVFRRSSVHEDYPGAGGEDARYTKRVLGLGGDELVFEDDRLVEIIPADGKAIPVVLEPVGVEPCGTDPMTGETVECDAFAEVIDSYRVRVLYAERSGIGFGSGERVAEVVPPDHLFLVGDNRDRSADSRYWGAVPVDNVEGILDFVWWSSGSDGIRWERLGASVDELK